MRSRQRVCIDVPNPTGGTERLGCNPDVHDLNVDVQAGAPLVTAGSVRWQTSHYHSIDSAGPDGVSLSYLQLFRCEISCSESIPAFMVSEAETTNTSFEMAGQLHRGQYVLYALSFGSRAQATPGSSLVARWDFLLEFDNVSAPVPEPAPAALALAGPALLVMRRRGVAG